MELTYHHTGLAVESIEESVMTYGQLFGETAISKTVYITSQSVKVCFVRTGPNSFIELIEGVGENSTINRMLKKGISYYHVAYTTEDIEGTVNKLIEKNYKAMSFFISEAFENKRCIFLFSPEGHLIELIEVC